MKIDNKIFYKLFYGSLDLKIEQAVEDSKAFKFSLSNVKALLKKYKPYVDSELSISYKKLIDSKPSILKGSLRDRIVKDDKVYSKEEFKYYYKTYLTSYERNKKHSDYIKSLKKQKVSFAIYSLIIKKFNLKIAKALIENQYVFNMGYNLGSLFVGRKINKKPAIDWDASNKKKARIIKKGLTPYYKKDKELAEKEGRKYKGVEWLIKHNRDSVWVLFRKTNTSKKYNFQMVKSNVSDSIKSYISVFKNSKKYNPKVYPLIEKK